MNVKDEPMLSIGIDAVEIERFIKWSHYSQAQLARIFSQDEIAYALSNRLHTAERLAVRFAAKEAFYKAFSSHIQRAPALFAVCRASSVIMTAHAAPKLLVNWDALHSPHYQTKLSLAHTRTTALAVVVLEP